MALSNAFVHPASAAAPEAARPAVPQPRVGAPAAPASAPAPRSSKGREFWFAYPNPKRLPSAGTTQSLLLFVSSDVPATGRLSVADASFTAITFSVVPGVVTTLTLPGETATTHSQLALEGITSKGLHLTATAEVSLYAVDFVQNMVDAYAAIPIDSAGTDYVVSSYLPYSDGYGQIVVVAQEDATQITVTYQSTTTKVPSYVGNVNIGKITDVVYLSTINASPPVSTVVLNAGQVFARAVFRADLSGTTVQSNKPVIVYGHSTASYVPADYGAADQLLETMPPVPTWGRRYVAMPTPNRAWGDTFRIYAAESDTTVQVNGRTLGTIGRGQWIEHRTKQRDTKYFTADKPIMVQQYMNGTVIDSTSGDPSMLTVQPLDQGMMRYTIATPKDRPQLGLPPGYGNDEYVNTLNIVAPEAPGVQVWLDGARVPNLIGGGIGFVTATASITPGSHLVTSTIPFILSVQGLRFTESYAYPGGSNYLDLSRVNTMTISPDFGDYAVERGNRCFIATVKDPDGVGIPGLPVYFYGPGDVIMAGGNADENGRATICYTGRVGDIGLKATAAWLEVNADVRWNSTPDANADMLDLTISPGPLSPAFVSNTTSYTASVPATTTSIIVTPAVYSTASYTITFAPGTCSPVNAPADCSLQTGLNTITVTVVSKDGSNTKDYVLQITREAPPSSDAYLGALEIHPGTLAPAFVSDTTSYTAEVANGVSSVVVTPTLNEPHATYTITGSPGACTPSTSPADCALEVGLNTITVTVTAQDGTTKEYVVIITRLPSNDANLLDLTIDPGTLAPAFVSDTTSYTAEVGNDVDVVTLTAQLSDPTALVSFEPCTPAGLSRESALRVRAGASSPSSANCVLMVGVNYITATVTAENGETKDYVIVVTRTKPQTTISLVWPNLGVPEGGMPVSIFGSGYSATTGVRVSNTITNVLVPFTITSDGRIDFIMPAGVAGTTADITVETVNGPQTAAQAFHYMAPAVVQFAGEAGTVITTPNGITITLPPQGVSGMFVITITPQTPEPGVPGSVLMHVFRLDAMLNGRPLTQLTNAVTISLPVDPAIVPVGETPYLWKWTAVGSRWSYVSGQSYDSGARQVIVALKQIGLYALSTSLPPTAHGYWFPLVPALK